MDGYRAEVKTGLLDKANLPELVFACLFSSVFKIVQNGL